jgi:Fic family protein
MDPSRFSERSPGRIVRASQTGLGEYDAFIPGPLPPKIAPSCVLMRKYAEALAALREVSVFGRFLPNADLLIVPYMKKEAELSSRIEGTQTTLADLYLFEMDQSVEVPDYDVREVLNYISALDQGLRSSVPLSIRLVLELHGLMLQSVRGAEERPGEFRRSQAYIAPTRSTPIHEATFVPPPPSEVTELMRQWEIFVHAEGEEVAAQPLIRTAISHYYFEAIHPFGDGNGRLGRLLIILMLQRLGLLEVPMLYLSAYFERHREEYYAHLQSVSEGGEWSNWLLFFMDGIVVQCRDAVERSRRILDLKEEYQSRLSGERSARLLSLLELAFKRPYLRTSDIALQFGVTGQSASNYTRRFVQLGILKELTGQYSHRLYRNEGLWQLLRD